MSFFGGEGKINGARLRLLAERRRRLLCFLLPPTPSRSVGPAALFGRLLINCRAWMKFHPRSNRKSPDHCPDAALGTLGRKTMYHVAASKSCESPLEHGTLNPVFAASCQKCVRKRLWPPAHVQKWYFISRTHYKFITETNPCKNSK